MSTLKALPLILLLAGALLGQGTPVDCTPGAYTITSATTTAALANSNTVTPCVSWRVTYNTSGFSALSIRFETSPDNSSWTAVTNSVCSASVQPPCVIDGSNPSTTTGNATFAIRAYGRYVRLNVTSVTGSGTITARIFGYKGLSAGLGGGGSGGGGGSSSGIPCAENPYTNAGGAGTKTCTHNIGISPPTMHILEAFDGNGTAPTTVMWDTIGTNADTFTLGSPPASNMYVFVSTGGTGPAGPQGAVGPTGPAGGTITVTNDTGTGTTTNLLAKIDSSGHAVLATTTDTAIPVYLCTSGCGTSGSATLLVGGSGTCQSDAGGMTAAHFVINSTATNGRCRDGGATAPTSGWVVGVAGGAAAANATFTLLNAPGYNASAASGGGAARPYIDYQTTKSAVLGDGTLFTTTIPANTMGTNGCFKIWFAISTNTKSGGANISFSWGGVTTAVTGLPATGRSGINAAPIIVCNRGATNAQDIIWPSIILDNASGNTPSSILAISYTGVSATGSIDTTANAAFSISVTSSSGGNSVTPIFWLVE